MLPSTHSKSLSYHHHLFSSSFPFLACIKTHFPFSLHDVFFSLSIYSTYFFPALHPPCMPACKHDVLVYPFYLPACLFSTCLPACLFSATCFIPCLPPCCVVEMSTSVPACKPFSPIISIPPSDLLACSPPTLRSPPTLHRPPPSLPFPLSLSGLLRR